MIAEHPSQMTAIATPERTVAQRAIAKQRETTSENINYRNLIWQPSTGPQTMAYESTADVIGYGGAAGGGKSDLLLGSMFTKHKKSIIFRSHFTDLTDLVTRGDDILAGVSTFVWGVKRRWNVGEVQVELGAIEHVKDRQKYRGRPHDGIGIDEASEFKEEIVRFLMAWLRTTDEGQRTQVILTFNPPSNPDGEWIITYFAPWLDGQHPNPAEPGELRWFIFVNDKDEEVDGPDIIERDGKSYTPQSRTFIPALLSDNPYLSGTDYQTQLENLKEPLRSQLLFGDFSVGTKDDAWQLIPTAWVLAAQERWRNTPKPDLALRAIGNDVAHGGADNSVIACLYGSWFDELIVHPGTATPDGETDAKYVEDVWDGTAPIGVDAIGYGASACDVMTSWGMSPLSINFGAGSKARDRTGRFEYFNQRAECWARFADALDPDSGEDICLPPSRTLRADLCAPRYKQVRGKIQLEEKSKIKERLGRSPDEGDTVVLCWRAAQIIGYPVVLDW